MKGAIQADHIAVNNYELLVLGMPPLTPIEITGIEDELETVDLPDRTVASGGNRGTGEWEMMLPMHHLVEQGAMEIWFLESQDPVLPTYKKVATLIHKAVSGSTLRTYSMTGLFPYKRTLPDLELANEGEMASVAWGMKHDNLIPV